MILRKKRRRIQRQIDDLQDESPFRTTQFGSTRQHVAKEGTLTESESRNMAGNGHPLSARLISISRKKGKIRKNCIEKLLLSNMYFSNGCQGKFTPTLTVAKF